MVIFNKNIYMFDGFNNDNACPFTNKYGWSKNSLLYPLAFNLPHNTPSANIEFAGDLDGNFEDEAFAVKYWVQLPVFQPGVSMGFHKENACKHRT